MVARDIAAALLAAFAFIAPAADVQANPFLRIVDSAGSPITSLEIGANLEVAAVGLAPNSAYLFKLELGGQAVSVARLMSDSRGRIGQFILWFQTGVIGCAVEVLKTEQKFAVAFADFDKADSALRGQSLTLILNDGSAAVARTSIPLVQRSTPMVFASDEKGCLLTAAPTGGQMMYVSGYNFSNNERVELSVVPNQRRWHVGDPVDDVTGPSGGPSPKMVHTDLLGRFTEKTWEPSYQRRGAYDIVARRVGKVPPAPGPPTVRAEDVVSFARDTGYILFLTNPRLSSYLDIAGRPLRDPPYFQFTDAFAADEDVWAVFDPTYVPAGRKCGTEASYYVVDHRTPAQWIGDRGLTDVSGHFEIVPLKAGCMNGTDIPVWRPPLTVGSYDVVVNTSDFRDRKYDGATDHIDGAVRIGFRVAADPYDLGATPVGQASYSFDNALFLSNSVSTYEGGAPGSANVDLRAVVRYPATAAGANTPVAPGPHPIFIIQHGNHSFCNVPAASHAACPVNQRKPNHMGYMHLLEALASNGIIAVSIDAYDLTGPIPQWIAERGDLILKHLEFWSHLNSPATYPAYTDPFAGRFAGRVDLTKISVSGHSRGGEASVAAYVRNLLRPAAQRFAIGSVSSIAPVDGQSYVLGDVPYFVILPASDCDVSALSGVRIYDRAGTPTGLTVKSGINVYGANHNFFNTVWAADWDDCPNANRKDYIPAAGQQKIGEAYLTAFVRSQLLGQTVYDDMLRGRMTFASTAGRKIHHFRHERNHFKLDAGTAAGTPAGGATETAVVNPSVHQTQAVRLGWSATGQSYAYTMPPTNVSAFSVLSFRAAQTNANVNPASGSQEFMVRLTGGATSWIYTGAFEAIPRPYDRGWGASNQNVMSTVRIPLQSFVMSDPAIFLTAVTKVEFVFDYPYQGEIYIDDVEFSQ